MDRDISAREANQRFSELLRQVARVVPVEREADARAVAGLLDRLAELPIRISGDWSRGDLYE